MSATLFLVFMDDLLILLFNGKASAFADDIAYFHSGKFAHDIWVDISEDLELLRYWWFKKKMKVNVSKQNKNLNFSLVCCFIFPKDLFYHISNCAKANCRCKVIGEINNLKYLGVVLDKNFNW